MSVKHIAIGALGTIGLGGLVMAANSAKGVYSASNEKPVQKPSVAENPQTETKTPTDDAAPKS